MKKNFLYITFSFLLLGTFSCSNEFLNDNIKQESNALSSDSEIILSPSWDTDDYQFICSNVGNADFTVENAPDWLEVETKTGKLTVMQPNNFSPNQQSVGIIRCKAKINPEFEKTGMYLDKIQISVNGKTCYVPVMYISEGDPKINVNTTFTINYNDYNSYLTIQNTGEGILLWDIVSMPEWLTIDANNFISSNVIIPQGSSYAVPLKFADNTTLSGILTGSIVLKTNDKNKPEVTISVTADLGTPRLELYWYSASIDFGRTETSQDIYISNQGYGALVWSFEGLPEWLSVSKANGTLYSYFGENVTFACNRALLPDGQSEVKIILKTNDVNKPATEITVRARNGNNNANVRAVEGNIIDACYNKDADILYYVTSQPNKLIVYDTKTKSVAHEIALSKAPTCLTVSEDFAQALVGHGGMISYIDLQTNSVTKTIEVNGVLADIAFAANDWCAYTEGGNYDIQWTNIYWVNLTDGSYTTGSMVYEDCVIKKVPNQDYIIGSETEMSSGFYVYDINTRTEKANIFGPTGNFWFIGNYIVSGNNSANGNASGDVFRISDMTSQSNLSAIGRLQYPTDDGYYGGIPFIDYCPASHSIFGLRRIDWNTISSQIYRFEDNDYYLTKVYNYEDYYNINGTEQQVQAHYVFANGAGTELSVLRKTTDNNNWSIEFIQITD